jgi:hypothetical protein
VPEARAVAVKVTESPPALAVSVCVPADGPSVQAADAVPRLKFCRELSPTAGVTLPPPEVTVQWIGRPPTAPEAPVADRVTVSVLPVPAVTPSPDVFVSAVAG